MQDRGTVQDLRLVEAYLIQTGKKHRRSRDPHLVARLSLCQKPGCTSGQRATAGKPYCIEHLLEMPYPKKVVTALEKEAEDRRNEIARVEQLGSSGVDLCGSVSREIIQYVRVGVSVCGGGPVTTRAINAGVEGLSPRIVAHYVKALRQARIVYLSQPPRGDPHRSVIFYVALTGIADRVLAELDSRQAGEACPVEAGAPKSATS